MVCPVIRDGVVVIVQVRSDGGGGGGGGGDGDGGGGGDCNGAFFQMMVVDRGVHMSN